MFNESNHPKPYGCLNSPISAIYFATELMKLIKYVEQTSGKHAESAEVVTSDLLQMPPGTTKERDLQSQVIHLQQSIGSLVEELQRQKMKNAQLERQVNTLVNKEDEA
jgi:serine/threonine-protein kinase OSR1/STK39